MTEFQWDPEAFIVPDAEMEMFMRMHENLIRRNFQILEALDPAASGVVEEFERELKFLPKPH